MLKFVFLFGILFLDQIEGLKIGICVPDISGSQASLLIKFQKKFIEITF